MRVKCAPVGQARQPIFQCSLTQGIGQGLEPQLRAHPCLHHHRTNRLGDEINGANLEGLHLKISLVVAGDKHHHDVSSARVGLEPTANLQPGETRHFEIKQQQVRLQIACHLQALSGRGAEVHIAVGGQRSVQHLNGAGVIINQQN